MRMPAERVLFISDVASELDAARAAGMHVVLARRPGNAAVPEGPSYPAVESFDDLLF
jgi:methionine salvage enolase-phosphatase E1